MKLKYYLRGVGVGIILTTLILTISYRANGGAKLSDEEIIKRAEKLGMVMQDDIDMDDIVAPTQTPTVTPTSVPTKEPTDKPGADQSKSGETSSDNSKAEDASEKTSAAQQKNSELTSAPDKEENTSKAISDDKKLSSDKNTSSDKELSSDKEPDKSLSADDGSDSNPVTVKIISGMTSEDVANLLKSKGVIEDAYAFNQFLKQNDYTTRIKVGVFQFEKYTHYQDIADAIVNK